VVAAARERASAAQQAKLQDGVVTLEEINAARQEVVKCAGEFGLDMDSHPGNGFRPASYSLRASTEESLKRGIQDLHECENTHSREIEILWAYQHASRVEEELQDVLPDLSSCVEEAVGANRFIPIESTSALNDFLAVDEARISDLEWVLARQAYGQCRILVEEATGLRLP
jgi:hypothetical protein